MNSEREDRAREDRAREDRAREDRAKAIFLNVLDIESEDGQKAYIETQCGPDEELKQEVRELIRHHAQVGSFLERTALSSDVDATIDVPIIEESGVQIGPYKLLQKIGEGGMGVVFMAEQQEPVKRRVAVKIIRPGMDTRQVIARFEAERQALAMMDHVNIATVLDAGATESGRPYFVMELIEGVPFVEYCDANRLTPRERLELFVPVCHAIQHAHQKGVIHRDIKPTNVLVTKYDDKPVPKVIDFGLAKAVEQRLTETSVLTQFGTMAGTIQYMSPEQVEMNALGIDTRSDIYSLGVLLYRMLTGTTPLEREELRNRAFGEIVRMIKEEEPPRPSERLSSSDAAPKVAVAYGTEPARLSSIVRGDLDWIVMRCLEKDRTRRYETANGLARDIQRYLMDEVVEARPPSTSYRLKKFVKRNRGTVIAASLIWLALLTGIAGTTFGLFRAEGQRVRAVKGEKLAERRLEQVQREKDKVQREKQIAQAARDFLLKKLLGQADVTVQADALLEAGELAAIAKKNPTIRELLDRAAAELSEDKIEASFPGEPLVQASILYTVGVTYLGVGEYESAIKFLRRSRRLQQTSLGARDADTLHSMHALACAYDGSGEHDRAVEIFEETLELRESTLGTNDPETLQSRNDLVWAYTNAGQLDKALPFAQDSYELHMSVFGAFHRKTISSLNTLFVAHLSAGTPGLALPLLQDAVTSLTDELGRKHPHTLNCMNTLAAAYLHAGQFKQALPLADETLRAREDRLGEEHPYTLSTAQNLALIHHRMGDLEKALSLLQQTAARTEASLGPRHTETLTVMHNLAAAYADAGEPERALPLFEKTLEHFEQELGPEHHRTLAHMVGLVVAYLKAGQPDKALKFAQKTLERHKSGYSSDHPRTSECARLVEGCKSLQTPLDEYAAAVADHGTESRQALKARVGLSNAFRKSGLPVAAEFHLRPVVVANHRTLGEEHKSTLWAKHRLAWVLHRQPLERKRVEAVRLEKEVLLTARTVLGDDDNATRQFAKDFWQICVNSGKVDEDSIVLMHRLVEDGKLTKLVADAASIGLVDRGPVNLRVAALSAWFDDEEAYTAAVSDTLDLAKETQNPAIASLAAMACVLRSTDDRVRLASALELARTAATSDEKSQQMPSYQLVRGICEYRNGHFEVADDALRNAIESRETTSDIKDTAQFYRAMNLEAQGKSAEARNLAESTAADMRRFPPKPTLARVFSATADDLILWLAYREVRALIEL